MQKYGTHYQIDDSQGAFGFDFSQVEHPLVSNNSLLSIFLNGTFYNTDEADATYVTHPPKIGNVSKQRDFMIYVSQSVFDSGLNALGGGLNISNLMKTVFNKTLVYSDFTDWNNVISKYGKNDEEVGLEVFVEKVTNLKLTQDRIDVTNGTLRLVFTDKDGILLSNYSVSNITVGLNVQSRPKFAQIYGKCDIFNFSRQSVDHDNGVVWMDDREVEMDTSERFVHY